MRMTKPVYFPGAALFLVLVFFASQARADLMASVYPGAVPANEELREKERYFEEAFYVRDSIQEVVAFYEREFGPMEEVRAEEKYRNVRRQAPRFKASFEPDQIGVRAYANPHKSSFPDRPTGISPEQAAGIQAMMPDRCKSDHFSSLRLMAQQLDKYDWKDFEAVCDRFDHIDRAYFQLTDQKDDRGAYLRKDQVLLNDQQNKLGMAEPEQMDAEQMAQRIQELQQQGKFQEMAELSRKMAEQAMHGAGVGSGGKPYDNWEEWVNYLERLDGYAFQTMIRINRDPSAWPDRAIR